MVHEPLPTCCYSCVGLPRTMAKSVMPKNFSEMGEPCSTSSTELTRISAARYHAAHRPLWSPNR